MDDYEKYGELARRLYAAWLSDHLRITLAYAYSHYAKNSEDVGEFWIELAKKTRDGVDVLGALGEMPSG